VGETPTKKIFFSRAIERRMSELNNDSLGTNHFFFRKHNLGFSSRIDFLQNLFLNAFPRARLDQKCLRASEKVELRHILLAGSVVLR